MAVMNFETELRAIDWSQLSCLYGDSEDLPELLRSMASSDRDRARAALEDLSFHVFGTGDDVIDGTAGVIPFLWTLALKETVLVRSNILLLLADIAECVNIWRAGAIAHGEPDLLGDWSTVWAALNADRIALGSLMSDRSAEVRAAAVQITGQIGTPSDFGSMIRTWHMEDDSDVRDVIRRASVDIALRYGMELKEHLRHWEQAT